MALALALNVEWYSRVRNQGSSSCLVRQAASFLPLSTTPHAYMRYSLARVLPWSLSEYPANLRRFPPSPFQYDTETQGRKGPSSHTTSTDPRLDTRKGIRPPHQPIGVVNDNMQT